MIIDGKKIAEEIESEIQQEIQKLKGRRPGLAVILVGDHPPSHIYVNKKIEACHKVGIHSVKRQFPNDITEEKLLIELQKLNRDPHVDGILVQLPLPKQINPITIIQSITPEKDVDGLHPINVGKLFSGDTSGFVSCTPLGIKTLLERAGINVQGKRVLVLGRSNLVGKPVAALLMQNADGANATVTVAHSLSKNIPELCRSSDIIISAMGNPKFITLEMVKEGTVIIDVGIIKIDDPTLNKGYRIVGDVDFDAVKDKCSFITPVPGGVGPMTIAMLLSNTLKSFLNKIDRDAKQTR